MTGPRAPWADPRPLSRQERAATAQSIVAMQLPTGMVQWFGGGHADPWNHVEALMALVVCDRVEEADAGFRWLADTQHPDGGWWHYYLAEGVESYRRDTNVCAYVAAGAWHHFLTTGDHDALAARWPMVEQAIDFVLRLQRPGGEITWCYEVDGEPGQFALLTGSSSIYHSLCCAIAVAAELGKERPEWELGAGRLRHAVAHRPAAFEPKERWAMDWYYPVLSGAVVGEAARARLREGWSTFVMDGLGVRCVSDKPWVTAAETAECVLALEVCGMAEEARALYGCLAPFRDADGSYWTGTVFPEEVHFPGGERSTYTSAAVLLADDLLFGTGPAARFFAGAGIPEVAPIAPELTLD